jgi:small-conductance mechanosensitive channel
MANFAADKTKNIINYQLIAVGVIVEFQFVGIEM